MRSVLAAKSSDLQEFKLQFNCCGTGVEKVRVRCSSWCNNAFFWLCVLTVGVYALLVSPDC